MILDRPRHDGVDCVGMANNDSLLVRTDQGLYCPAGDFHIDPHRPVARAVITHGHADHAHRGMRSYLCHRDTVPILQHRLGPSITVHGVRYSETVVMHGVRVSLHPAGHIVGSAQVRIEHRGEVWVVSGDYKRQIDPWAEAFSPVGCHTFITETTFGLPVYRWPDDRHVAASLNAWWRTNADSGLMSVVQCYSLGKAQRLHAMLDTAIGPVLAHPSIVAMHDVLREHGIGLPALGAWDVALVQPAPPRAMLLTPTPSASPIGHTPVSYATASGWAAVQSPSSRNGTRRGFVVSDHVDWPDLIRTIDDTGAERVYATHGYTEAVVRFLRERGTEAYDLAMLPAIGHGHGSHDNLVAPTS